mmetsp:Transcript_69278/g.108391  ORF Transcript_69278/g.108391 Transcript_69278/m.108391 type:complete len:226 (+) Transcript_69278:753-1430(+)
MYDARWKVLLSCRSPTPQSWGAPVGIFNEDGMRSFLFASRIYFASLRSLRCNEDSPVRTLVRLCLRACVSAPISSSPKRRARTVWTAWFTADLAASAAPLNGSLSTWSTSVDLSCFCSSRRSHESEAEGCKSGGITSASSSSVQMSCSSSGTTRAVSGWCTSGSSSHKPLSLCEPVWTSVSMPCCDAEDLLPLSSTSLLTSASTLPSSTEAMGACTSIGLKTAGS